MTVLPQLLRILRSPLRWSQDVFTIVLALAVGVGATTVAFSLVYTVLLEELPFADPGRLVLLYSTSRVLHVEEGDVTGGDFEYWKSHTRSFERMAAFRTFDDYFSTPEGLEKRPVSEVSPDFLPLLGVHVALGRNFVEDDQQPGSRQVAILSHAYWRLRYGGDPSVIGKSTQFSQYRNCTIIGVLPTTFQFFSLVSHEEPLVYFPIERNRIWYAHVNRVFQVIGRLRRESSLDRASAEVRVIAAALEQQYPRTNAGYAVRLAPFRTQMEGRWKAALWIIFSAAGVLLLVSCSNVSALILFRLTHRQKEIALRAALGATRLRVASELISETLAISFLSSALGFLTAFLVLRVVRSSELISQLGIPRIHEVGVNPVVLGFTILTTAGISFLCTLAPAVEIARADVNQILRRDAGRMVLSGFTLRCTELLALIQVALTVVLLDCSFFMLRDLWRLQNLPLGYNYRDVLTISVEPILPQLEYSSFWQTLLENVGRLPAVQSVATSYPLPCEDFPLWEFKLVEGSVPVPQLQQGAKFQNVTANYFTVMQVPLLRGRLFTATSSLWEPGSVILSRTLAQRYWGNEDPIGQHIVVHGRPQPFTIIGVVADASESLFQVTPPPLAYLSRPLNWAYVLVRTRTPLVTATPMIVGTVRGSARRMPVDRVKTLESVIFAAAAQPRVQTLLASAFAVMALLLALVGLYATMSFSVARRIRELGIRIALGATKHDIVALLVSRNLKIALVGVTLGTASALAFTRLLATVLYGVGTVDLFALATVPIAVTVLCILASYVPARRAAHIDASELLRSQ